MLIEELLSAQGRAPLTALQAAAAAAYADEQDDLDDGWEDEAPVFDLGNAATKKQLMEWGMDDGNGIGDSGARFVRLRDDETQTYLEEWFLNAAKGDLAGFKGWWDGLTESERAKLDEVGRVRGEAAPGQG